MLYGIVMTFIVQLIVMHSIDCMFDMIYAFYTMHIFDKTFGRFILFMYLCRRNHLIYMLLWIRRSLKV